MSDKQDEQLKNIQKELQDAIERAENNLKGWQRAAADFENHKRRTEESNARLMTYAQDQVILTFLQNIQDLERVLQYLPQGSEEFVQWREGAEQVRQNFYETLKHLNVEKIKTMGEMFNPEFHEAVDMVPGGEKGVIAEEVFPGYRREERLLRPAQVKVYSGREIDTKPGHKTEQN